VAELNTGTDFNFGFGGSYKDQDTNVETSFKYDPATYLARQGSLEWLQKLLGGGMYGGAGAPDLGAIAPMIARLMGITSDPNATERGGLQRADRATDIGEMVRTEGNAFNAITSPALRSQMAATGGGRSGALAEQIGLAGTRASVPLAQTQNQRLMDAARLYAQVGGAAGNRELGALGTAGQLGLGGINATNQYNIADLTSGRGAQSDWIRSLMQLLNPLQTGGATNTSQTGWNVDVT